MASQRTDPASPGQVRFIRALVSEAFKREYITAKDLNEVYDAVMATDPSTTWHVAGPRTPVSQLQVDSSVPNVYYGGIVVSMGDAGRFIDMLLTWMPDMAPKKKPRPAAQDWSNPAPKRLTDDEAVASPIAPEGEHPEAIIQHHAAVENPVMVIVVPLADPLSAEQVESLTELFGMFIRSKTSVDLAQGKSITVHWTQWGGIYDGTEGGHVEQVT